MLDDETDLRVQGLTSVAEEAAKALVEIGPGVREEVLAEMSSPKAAVRGRCAYVLGKLRDPAAAAVLNDAAKNETSVLARISIIRALGSIRNRSSIVHLLGMLNDPQEAVADAVVHALADFGYTAIKPLTYNLKDPDPLKRANAARALGFIKDPLVIDNIVEMSHDKMPVVRSAAAEALGSLNMIQAIDPLIKMLGDEDNRVKNRALKSLKVYSKDKVIKPVIMRLDTFDDETAAEARRIIFETDKSMTLPLIKTGLSTGSVVLQKNLLQIINEINDQSLLSDVISLLRTTPSAEIKHMALDTIIKMGDKSVVDILNETLSESDMKVKAHALSGLISFNEVTRDAADMVEEMLYNPNKEVRVIVAKALPFTDSYRLTPIMDEALLKSDTPEVKVYVLKSLGKLKYVKSLEKIAHLMNDPSTDVRIAAMEAMVEIGHKDSTELFKNYINDNVPEIRMMAIRGLKNTFTSKLQDKDHRVRAEAADALGAADDQGALNMLIQVFYDDEHIVPRMAALRALTDINTDLTAAFELDGLKSRNKSLKKAAIECAVKFKNKDVYLSLVNIVKDDDKEIAALAVDSLKEISNKNYDSYDDWLKWAVKQK